MWCFVDTQNRTFPAKILSTQTAESPKLNRIKTISQQWSHFRKDLFLCVLLQLRWRLFCFCFAFSKIKPETSALCQNVLKTKTSWKMKDLNTRWATIKSKYLWEMITVAEACYKHCVHRVSWAQDMDVLWSGRKPHTCWCRFPLPLSNR